MRSRNESRKTRGDEAEEGGGRQTEEDERGWEGGWREGRERAGARQSFGIIPPPCLGCGHEASWIIGCALESHAKPLGGLSEAGWRPLGGRFRALHLFTLPLLVSLLSPLRYTYSPALPSVSSIIRLLILIRVLNSNFGSRLVWGHQLPGPWSRTVSLLLQTATFSMCPVASWACSPAQHVSSCTRCRRDGGRG